MNEVLLSARELEAHGKRERIIAPIPGKGRIGFEIPNDVRSPVNLRELIEDQRFEKLSERAPLPVVSTARGAPCSATRRRWTRAGTWWPRATWTTAAR